MLAAVHERKQNPLTCKRTLNVVNCVKVFFFFCIKPDFVLFKMYSCVKWGNLYNKINLIKNNAKYKNNTKRWRER